MLVIRPLQETDLDDLYAMAQNAGKGLTTLPADRDLLPDADLLGACVREALDELLDSATGGRTRAPRGRRKRKQETQG